MLVDFDADLDGSVELVLLLPFVHGAELSPD